MTGQDDLHSPHKARKSRHRLSPWVSYPGHCPVSKSNAVHSSMKTAISSQITTRPFVALLAVILSSLGPALAAEPLLEKVDLFTAGQDGYALYRIPGIVV